MKLFLSVIFLLTAIIFFYVLIGRSWLKAQPWTQGFFEWIEPYEIVLFKKSETILWARLKMFVGILLTMLTQLGALDLTPLMPLVPDQYEPAVRLIFNFLPLAITAVGLMDERLRNNTTEPIEITALPEKAIPVEVKEAVAQANEAKAEAVAVVEEAKKAGEV